MVAAALAGMLLLGQTVTAHASGNQGAIYRGPTDGPTVALTFDDGYAPERCLQIAGILTESGVPATWFPNGIHVAAAPTVWRSIAQRFPIANHTLDHASLVGRSARRIRQELQSNEAVIERVTGKPMVNILRPTFGAYDDRVLRVAGELGYRVVLWDVTAADTSPRGTDRGIAASALSGSNGSIVLMHCGPEVTPRILPVVIGRYAFASYRFATLPALLAGRPGKRARVDCPPPRLPERGRRAVGPSPQTPRSEATARAGSSRDSRPKKGRPARGESAATAGLERFYAQTPTWTDCTVAPVECASLDVPLDYADPEAGSVEVAVYRAESHVEPATPLIVGTGTPATPAVVSLSTFATGAGRALSFQYDFVGFERREAEDGAPSASLARSMVVADEVAARDLDILRAVLGQERLDYYGASFGTSRGAVYTALFPERVGRMVLDGPVEHTALDQEGMPMPTVSRMDGAAPEAASIMVIETADDQANPIEWVRGLGGQPPSSVFVGHDGAGRPVYGEGNRCVDDAVNAFFLEGRVPEDGTTC